MSLEIVTHPPVAFSDERGVIVNGVSGPVLRHAALITSAPGAVRANHVHPAKIGDATGDQYIWLLEGVYVSVACACELGADGGIRYLGQPEVQEVRPGDVAYTPPLVAHAQWFTAESRFLNLDGVTREHEGYGVRHTFPLAQKLIDGACACGAPLAASGVEDGRITAYTCLRDLAEAQALK